SGSRARVNVEPSGQVRRRCFAENVGVVGSVANHTVSGSVGSPYVGPVSRTATRDVPTSSHAVRARFAASAIGNASAFAGPVTRPRRSRTFAGPPPSSDNTTFTGPPIV